MKCLKHHFAILRPNMSSRLQPPDHVCLCYSPPCHFLCQYVSQTQNFVLADFSLFLPWHVDTFHRVLVLVHSVFCRSLPNKFQVSHERVLFSARKSELNFTLHTPFQNFFTWFKRNPLAGFFGRSDKNSRPKNSSRKKLGKNSKKLKQMIKNSKFC